MSYPNRPSERRPLPWHLITWQVIALALALTNVVLTIRIVSLTKGLMP